MQLRLNPLAVAVSLCFSFTSLAYAETSINDANINDSKVVYDSATTFTAETVNFVGHLTAKADLKFKGNLISTYSSGNILAGVVIGDYKPTYNASLEVAGDLNAADGIFLSSKGRLSAKSFKSTYLTNNGTINIAGKLEVTDPGSANASGGGQHSSNTNLGSIETGSFVHAGIFNNYGTMTIKDGVIGNTNENADGFFNNGNLYLNADDAKICGVLRLGAKAIVSKADGEAFHQLEVTKKLYVAPGSNAMINGNLLTHGTNLQGGLKVNGIFRDETTETYSLLGGAIEAKEFISNKSIKVGTNVTGSLTVNKISTPNMLRIGSVDSSITVTESVSAGSFYNRGTLKASTATIELTGVDAKTHNGKAYAFVNGNDKDFDPNEASNATANIGTLIVHGNAMNTSHDQASMNVTELVVDETLVNESSLNAEHGTLTVGQIEGQTGNINLRGSSLVAQNSSNFGSVNADDSTITVGAGTYKFTNLSGENKSILVKDLNVTEGIDISSQEGNLSLKTTADQNDKQSNALETANKLNDLLTVQDTDGEITIYVPEGSINGRVEAVRNAEGELENVKEAVNTKLYAFGNIEAVTTLALRHEMNSLNKRMGELRDAPDGVGAWVRAYGSEMEYGAQNIVSKNNTIQMGSDFTVGDWKIGAAFTYMDGESSYDNGTADQKGYGVAVYGAWFVPCGAYVDLLAKYNRVKNEFALGNMSGSYHANSYAVSAETGYRFEFKDGGLFVEPQLGLSYGYIGGESLMTSNNVRIDQDSYDSFIGRLGIRTGFKFPKDKGSVYARVSGVYDFQGEVNGKASNEISESRIHEDLGGAWLEMGVGANFNWTKNTYSYIDFERTNGGEVKENYRWNVGVRHTF